MTQRDTAQRRETTAIEIGAVPTGARRTRELRLLRRRWQAVAAVAGLLASATAVVAAAPTTAGASTLDGVATTASPGTTSYLASGGSTSNFTVSLPAQAACSGDSATHGYRVFSYLVEAGTNVATITFPSGQPNFGANQYGLIESDGNFWEDVNTAPTTGQIIGIPNDFEWEALIAKGLSLNTLLYQSSNTSGVWEGGIACTNSSGVVSDYWNTQITFTSSGTDPNHFVWSAVPGPAGSKVPAITSANNADFSEGQSNTFTPTATGNPAPIITEHGTLPSGVTFTGGSLTGDPTQTGVFDVSFTATNGIGNPAVQQFTLAVGFQITTASPLPSATIGSAYSDTLTAAGGTTPYTWKSTGLPKGLKLNKTTGTIAGTTSKKDKVQTYTVAVTVTDKHKPKDTATGSFSLTLNA